MQLLGRLQHGVSSHAGELLMPRRKDMSERAQVTRGRRRGLSWVVC